MPSEPLRLCAVSRDYGSVKILQNINLEIHTGEFLVIVGPSGCGKTTLLNLLSGFDTPSSGSVERNGIVRTVYQSDGLFPWLTAGENIELGLRDLPEQERKAARRELLALIRMEDFEDHYPYQLSGGMNQRVELARALAGKSDILLLDEPFSSLDYQTRLRMRRELVRLLHERPRTVVFVTHDIEEAAQLADRVVVLTNRPSTIQKEYIVDTPRPRELTHPDVVRVTERILHDLGLEGDSSDAQVLNVQ